MTGGKAPRARGDRFERLCRHHLEGDHDWLVIRSGGSLGPADLVAFRSDHAPWFISCKASERPYLRPEEWSALWHFAVGANACPILAYKAGAGAVGIVFLILLAPERGRGKLPPFKRVNPW